MMRSDKALPIGVDSFEKLISGNYYYADKTLFIRDFVRNHGEVCLFTRPRRFGKTLNMSMLKSFFDVNEAGGAVLFRGLAIEKETALCDAHMGKYPVVSISLKGVKGLNFDEAFHMFKGVMRGEVQRLRYLLDSPALAPDELYPLRGILENTATKGDYQESLKVLSRLLYKHHGRKAIILIDEYDVPLEKAYNAKAKYYDEMVDFISSFFQDGLKTNPFLEFAVVTGCLRISKESIFTGLNNLDVNSITTILYDEYFGFVEEDAKAMLRAYGLSEHFDELKEWYDGYRFGDSDVYNPWDVLNHVKALTQSPDAMPRAYWDNTSSNSLVRRFIDKADATTREDIERLIAGEAVEKLVHENITYDELDKTVENLWNVLFLTGYLTQAKTNRRYGDSQMRLVIPNREVRQIFVEKIRDWFAEKVAVSNREALFQAIWRGDAESFSEQLRLMLLDTISYHDYHENYYHAFLAGVLAGGGYAVRSNREAGEGRSDITMEDGVSRRAVIFETKVAQTYDDLEKKSGEVLEQIEGKNYAHPYLNRRYTVYLYGLAFNHKDCLARGRRLTPPPARSAQ